MTLRLKCACGMVLTAAPSMAGKRGRCKTCGHIFTVPQQQLSSKTEENAAFSTNVVADRLSDKQHRSEDSIGDDARNRPKLGNAANRSPARTGGKACPECAATIHDAIVCLQCGYHTRLRRKLKTLDAQRIASTKWFIFLTVVPVCLLYVTAAYLLLDSMTGPTFLLYFFAGFCACGILTPILRSLWFDTDVFNYLALGTLEAAGMIRLVNAVMERNHKISFLLLGMVLVPLVFLLPRTENDNDASEPFRSKQGGMALTPYFALFTSIVVILASVYFVPSVSQYVASFRLIIPGIGGFATLAALNPSVIGSLGKGGYSGGYSSWLSCGGGGGCGGGGCGGGGCGGCGG